MRKLIYIIFVSLLLVPFQNCSNEGGTILGNPLSEKTDETSLEYDAYSPGGGSSPKVMAKSGLVPLAVEPGLEITVCLRRTTFYQYNSPIKQMFDIGLGEIELQEFGTQLGTYNLAHGPYKRVQLKFRADGGLCPDEASVRVKNSNGEFYTQSWFRVNYDDLGQLIDGPGQSIKIEVNTLVDALRDVDSNQAIDQAMLGSGIATYW